jgi:hypothetical protein
MKVGSLFASTSKSLLIKIYIDGHMPAFINKLENITSPSMGPVEPIDEAG